MLADGSVFCDVDGVERKETVATKSFQVNRSGILAKQDCKDGDEEKSDVEDIKHRMSKKSLIMGVSHKARGMVGDVPLVSPEHQAKIDAHKERRRREVEKSDDVSEDGVNHDGHSDGHSLPDTKSPKPRPTKKTMMLGVGHKARGMVGDVPLVSPEHQAKIDAHKERRRREVEKSDDVSEDGVNHDGHSDGHSLPDTKSPKPRPTKKTMMRSKQQRQHPIMGSLPITDETVRRFSATVKGPKVVTNIPVLINKPRTAPTPSSFNPRTVSKIDSKFRPSSARTEEESINVLPNAYFQEVREHA